MKNVRHISETYSVGVLLAVVGGFFDAYTYICRGGVFANAQTGNIVLLAINATQRNFLKCFYYLVPVLSFVVGVFVVEFFKMKFNDNPQIHWHRIVVICEIIILLGVAFIPQGNLNPVANILISFICAMQVEAFRKMEGNPFATTMCTGNLRSGTDNLFQFFKSKDRSKLRSAVQYYGIIVCFITGAAVGVIFTKLLGTRSILVSIVILAAVLIILRTDNEKKVQK